MMLRVIGGDLRGARLAAPEGLRTRPIADAVREALFNILGSFIEGAAFYDLFAGSGSVGIEALSRGAACAVFVEKDREAVAVLRKNLDRVSLTERAVVVLGDCFELARQLEPCRPGKHAVVFLGPPYPLMDTARGMARMSDLIYDAIERLVSSVGVVILQFDFRRHKDGVERMAENFQRRLRHVKTTEFRKYGRTGLLLVDVDCEQLDEENVR